MGNTNSRNFFHKFLKNSYLRKFRPRKYVRMVCECVCTFTQDDRTTYVLCNVNTKQESLFIVHVLGVLKILLGTKHFYYCRDNSLAESAEAVGVVVTVTADLRQHGGLEEEHLLLCGLPEHVASHVLVPHNNPEFLVHLRAFLVPRVVLETKERAAE